MIDIHNHILPGLDNGAGSWDQSMAMARVAIEGGI
ncbi:MAG: CpsB/CapC family capsule biosynthesis tyrosine phosphatase [Deltaproteobacteria bacterium]